MNTIPILEADGRRFYYMFLAGAKKIIENQVHLNKINVFPVNDGDTGTNMAGTVRAVLETVKPNKSYKMMVELIAESTLINARGNSGIIFAQFLYGVSNETAELKTISIQQFIVSIKNSVDYVYKAVANPQEGTMLTMIKTWADYIHQNRHKFDDFNQLFISSKSVLEKTLAETKNKLQVLKNANVVDAGANAFLYFIEGIIEVIQRKNIRHLVQDTSDMELAHDHNEHIPEHVEHRYCTEAIIKNLKINHQDFTKILQKSGDSLVIAGSEKTTRIHIHTNHPAHLFDQLRDYGTITLQKADDMLLQSQSIYHRKWNIALVTDSTCDLSQELLDEHQIHMLPMNIYFGEHHFLDKVSLQADQFYKRLDEGVEFPKTAQINEVAFTNLYSHLASHYDAVIAVHLTEKFSGTYFSSAKAAEKISKEFKKPIMVIDSKNLSGGLGLIVYRIAKAIESGSNFEEIKSLAPKWVEETKIFVSVKTLKYMVKGGRVSPLKGLIAKWMNVKPIVSMDENGKSLVFGKAYSQKANMEKVMKHVQLLSKNKTIWNYIVLHANNEEAANWYAKEMKTLTNKEAVSLVNISPVIGANAGIGAASVAFMYD